MATTNMFCFFLILIFVSYIRHDISCALVVSNLTSDFVGEAQYGTSPNHVRGKSIKRRQALGDWCEIPPPMPNGKYRPSTLRCPVDNNSPSCQMLEGAYVFPEWVIYVDYCDPGYVVTSKNTVAACFKGRWIPNLPTCGVCPPSDTLVNGKAVCRGDVIFEDTFSGTMSNKWRNRVSYSGESDMWKFNEWTSDKKNIFISNGSLVIKPTVHHEAYLTSGVVEIDGCSEERGSWRCKRTGSQDKILSPIATADLHTFNTFSFTYGELEIRAKLPKGDWLMPGLYFESVEHYYGGGDTSGVIELGVTLGNSDLRCRGEDFGLGRVVSRLSIGPEHKTQFFHKNLPETWHDYYHNYTFIWKPSGIVFKTDNELIGEVTPGDKTLCETFNGRSKDDCSIYSKGSKMAPFDKDIFISLSLSAGDLATTDGCLNRGRVKPWKIYDPQATLQFWQDRRNWLRTWTEEGSSLYIDHIRVTAV